MIDYDELDDRIRRIVREELVRSEPNQVKSLQEAVSTRDYLDASGDRWFYFSQLRWMRARDNLVRDQWDTEQYGPFTEVRE